MAAAAAILGGIGSTAGEGFAGIGRMLGNVFRAIIPGVIAIGRSIVRYIRIALRYVYRFLRLAYHELSRLYHAFERRPVEFIMFAGSMAILINNGVL